MAARGVYYVPTIYVGVYVAQGRANEGAPVWLQMTRFHEDTFRRAMKAGVKTQDILLEINDKPINVRFPEEVAPARKMIAPADPLTYADLLKQHQLLMIAASRDDVVPPKAARTLWEATGKPKIIWIDATHIGAALYVFDVAGPIVEHLKGK